VFTPLPPTPPPSTIIKQLHSFPSTLLPTLGKVFRQVLSKKLTTGKAMRIYNFLHPILFTGMVGTVISSEVFHFQLSSFFLRPIFSAILQNFLSLADAKSSRQMAHFRKMTNECKIWPTDGSVITLILQPDILNKMRGGGA
jgi:hypothetical protein